MAYHSHLNRLSKNSLARSLFDGRRKDLGLKVGMVRGLQGGPRRDGINRVTRSASSD